MYKAAFISANSQGIDTQLSFGGHTLPKVASLREGVNIHAEHDRQIFEES